MEMKSCPLLSAVLLILVTSFHYQVSAVSDSPPIVEDWQPIKDLNSPLVLEIVKFAVSEHNKEGAKLQFVKVVKGESLVMFGMNYKLVITANDGAVGNAPGNYEVVVWEVSTRRFRILESFTKL